MKQFTITKKVAKQGNQSIIILPKLLNIKPKDFNIPLKGRFQKVNNFILDGAHTPESIQETLKTMDKLYKNYNLVLALSKNKKAKQILKTIESHKKELILTKSTYKPMPPKEMQKLTKLKTKILPLKTILTLKEPTLITGSLYLVGDSLNLLENKKA